MTGFLITYPRSLFVPQELTERIYHYLKVDFKSLSSSALVCRSWASASRRCLFEKMTIMPELAQRLQGLQVDSLLPSIAIAHCRTLHIRNVINSATFCPFVAGGSATLCQHPLQPLFATLTNLTISHSDLPPLTSYMVFVSCFSSLQSLSFDEVRFSKESIETKCSPFITLLSSVKSLSVRNVDVRQFFTLVNGANLLGNVTHLRLGPIGQWDSAAVAQYMLRISTSLEHFCVQFTEPKGAQDYMCGIVPIVACSETHLQSAGRSPALKSSPSNAVRDEYRRMWGMETSPCPLPNLNTVRIEDYVDVHKGHLQTTARFWTPRLIASILPPRLRRIELGLTLERAGQLDWYDINWKFLDYVLNSEDYAHLKQLVFYVDGIADLDNLGDLVSARLPLMTERGILRFCRSGES